MTRIGIDARVLAGSGGKGRYVAELEPRLRAACAPEEELVAFTAQSATGIGWHRATARAANRSCDVFLSTQSYLTPLALRIPVILVVHDLVAFEPRWRPQRRAAAIERTTLALTARRAAAILTDSRATRDDLLSRWPTLAGKATVVPLAAAPAFNPIRAPDDAAINARHGLRRPFVLAVGTLEPRKNLAALIAAFETVPDHIELVLVGPTGWEVEETLAAARGRPGRVRVLGRVDDGDLPAIYRAAELFCCPSLYEGFGLPVAEALQCGVPVIASNRSSLPEVANGAAVLVDPDDPAAIGAALQRLLADGAARARLAALGPRATAHLTWDATAAQTLAVIRRVAQDRRAGRRTSASRPST